VVSTRTANLDKVLRCINDAQIEPPGDESRLRLATVGAVNGISHMAQLFVAPALAQDRPAMIINNIFSLVDGCRRLNLLTREISKLSEAVGQAYSEVPINGSLRLHLVYDILEGFLRAYPHLAALATTPAGKLLASMVPSPVEKNDIEEMMNVLGVVRDRTGALSGVPSAPFTTLAQSAVALFAIVRAMGDFERKGKPDFIIAMAQAIRQAVQGLMDAGDGLAPSGQLPLVAIAAGLHPLLKDGCVYMPDHKKAREWSTTVRDLLVSAMKQTDHLWPRPAGPMGRPVSPPAKRQYVSREKDIAHAQFVEELKNSGAIAMDTNIAPPPPPGSQYTEADEVDEYMELRSDEFAGEDFSLLKFWAIMAHTHRFPRLARLARRVLCVPASTAGLDRALAMVKRHIPNVADPNDGQAINALLLVSRNDIAVE
jgi:hypothetical protein